MFNYKDFFLKFSSTTLPVLLYVVAIPFYMIEISYMTMISRGISVQNVQYMSPLFWGTIWIPAFLSFSINFLLKKHFQGHTPKKWSRNYPSVFIIFYSLYFFILSKFNFAQNCLIASICGIILILFLFLLKNAQKEMFYLPPPKEFWFYVLTFIPPISILFFTDVYFLIMKQSPYFILLAPISYLPEIFGFWIICLVKRHLPKKIRSIRLTLFASICIMQIFNILTSMYFATYWGEKIIWITLTFSLATILIAERFSKYKLMD